jgi:hypothetical protein
VPAVLGGSNSALLNAVSAVLDGSNSALLNAVPAVLAWEKQKHSLAMFKEAGESKVIERKLKMHRVTPLS